MNVAINQTIISGVLIRGWALGGSGHGVRRSWHGTAPQSLGGLLVHGVDPRPGSMCSSLKKPPEQELEGAVSAGEVLLCL